jgi:cysteinyl-tRNA synthetase
MGKERFGELTKMLPPQSTVVGLDEHTALTIDLDEAEARVTGQGRVTVVRGQQERTFAEGESFDLKLLGPFRSADLLAGLPQAVAREALAAAAAPEDVVPDEVLALANARQLARIERDWARADQLRSKIESLGWLVKDTPDGPALAPGPDHR